MLGVHIKQLVCNGEVLEHSIGSHLGMDLSDVKDVSGAEQDVDIEFGVQSSWKMRLGTDHRGVCNSSSSCGEQWESEDAMVGDKEGLVFQFEHNKVVGVDNVSNRHGVRSFRMRQHVTDFQR